MLKEIAQAHYQTKLYCYVCGKELQVSVRINSKSGLTVKVLPCLNDCIHPQHTQRGLPVMIKNKEVEQQTKIKNNDPQIEQDKDHEPNTDRPTTK
jgi:hypothetical protein